MKRPVILNMKFLRKNSGTPCIYAKSSIFYIPVKIMKHPVFLQESCVCVRQFFCVRVFFFA